MLKMKPRQNHLPLLSNLLQTDQLHVLQEAMQDISCYAPALAVALWREAVRPGGDGELVRRLLDAVAPVLPEAILDSIEKDGGSTAILLLQTMFAVSPPQVWVHGSRGKIVAFLFG